MVLATAVRPRAARPTGARPGESRRLNYLSEIVINLEGTGQMADMMKQMGGMKLTIRTTSVKSDPLSDDLFKVPEGYTIVK